MYEISDIANFTEDEFSGFRSLRKRLQGLKKYSNPMTLAKYGLHVATDPRFAYSQGRAGLNSLHFDEEFDGFEDEFSGFKWGKLNPFQRHTKFGKLIGKAANVASIIPGVGAIAGAVTQKLFNKGEVQSNPEAATMVAETPAQAASVVNSLAPSLPPAQQAAAVRDVMGANNPQTAGYVANELQRANAEAEKKKKQKSLYLKIGAGIGGAILLFLIIWLVIRKK